MQRAIDRYINGEILSDGTKIHRFVDPAYVEKGTYVDGVIPRFINNPFIDEVIIYDNNGIPPPKLIEKVEK